MNAPYWIPKDGQLRPGEMVHTGHAHQDDAGREAEALPARYAALVSRLETIESDYPSDDPRYEPFNSARWCVIVKQPHSA